MSVYNQSESSSACFRAVVALHDYMMLGLLQVMLVADLLLFLLETIYTETYIWSEIWFLILLVGMELVEYINVMFPHLLD